MFVSTEPAKAPSGRWKNKLYTRSLRRIGVVDNRFPTNGPYPRHDEHWLVDIVRENLTKDGGMFILKPVRKVERAEQMPLVVGMYDITVNDGAVILTPKEPGKFWVMSPSAKREILKECKPANAIIINHGGDPTWPRRMPAEDVLAHETKRLLNDKRLED